MLWWHLLTFVFLLFLCNFEALLSCLIGGIPVNRVHEFNFMPGEIRCNVDYNFVNAMASQPTSPTYSEILRRGRDELKLLRENPNITRNIKDLKYEEEIRLEDEKEKKEQERKIVEKEAMEKELGNQMKSGESNLATENNAYESSINPIIFGGVGAIAGVIGVVQNANKEPTLNGTDLALTIADSAILTERESDVDLNIVDDELNDDNVVILPPYDAEGVMDDDNNQMSAAESQQIESDYDDDWLGMMSEIANDVDGDDDDESYQ